MPDGAAHVRDGSGPCWCGEYECDCASDEALAAGCNWCEAHAPTLAQLRPGKPCGLLADVAGSYGVRSEQPGEYGAGVSPAAPPVYDGGEGCERLEDERSLISCPRDALAVLPAGPFEEERVHVVTLTNAHRVIGVEEVHRGGLSNAPARLAAIYRLAVRQNAAALILAHNHPTGDVTPSGNDLDLTRDAARAGELLDVRLLDHIVWAAHGDGPRGWYSIRTNHEGLWSE